MIPPGARIWTKIAPKRPHGGLRAGLGRPLGAKADFGPILEPILDPLLGLNIVEIRLGFRGRFWGPFGFYVGDIWGPTLGLKIVQIRFGFFC